MEQTPHKTHTTARSQVKFPSEDVKQALSTLSLDLEDLDTDSYISKKIIVDFQWLALFNVSILKSPFTWFKTTRQVKNQW